MDVHNYSPEKRFETAFMNDSLYNPQKRSPILGPSPTLRGDRGIPARLAEEKGGIQNPDYYVALYDGAVLSVDEQIGPLLRDLKRFGGNRNTLLILSADHGEMMGEHGGYFCHGGFPYEPLLRVPFILHAPSLLPAKRFDAQIRASLDIFPTVLGFLRIRGPKTLEGVDLLPVLKKNGGGNPAYVLTDEGYREKSIRTHEWKLIYFSPDEDDLQGAYSLFHIKDDPGEAHDVFSVEKNVASDLKEKMTAYMGRHEREERPEIVLGEEARRGLKSLGYLQ